jgi:hypothetical protein
MLSSIGRYEQQKNRPDIKRFATEVERRTRVIKDQVAVLRSEELERKAFLAASQLKLQAAIEAKKKKQAVVKEQQQEAVKEKVEEAIREQQQEAVEEKVEEAIREQQQQAAVKERVEEANNPSLAARIASGGIKMAANWYVNAAATTAAAALVGPALAPFLALALIVPATKVTSTAIDTVMGTNNSTAFTWDSMKSVTASVAGMGAVSAMSSLLFYGLFTDPFSLARDGTTLALSGSGLWGVPSFLASRVLTLAKSEWAWMRVVQYVAQRIGWNSIGGKVGKAIHEYLSQCERANVPVIPSRLREVAKSALGEQRTRDWVDTTWAEMLSGLSRDYVDLAANRAAVSIGRAGYDVLGTLGTEIGKIYSEGSADFGLSATLATIVSIRDSAYEGMVSALEASKSAFEGLKTAVDRGMSAVFGEQLVVPPTEVGPPTKVGPPTEVGKSIQELRQEALARAMERRAEREVRQEQVMQQIKAAQETEIKTALKQEDLLQKQVTRLEEQIANKLSLKEELTVTEQVELDVLNIQKQEVASHLETAKQLRETAYQMGGLGAKAFKGVTISAVAPQVFGTIGGKTAADIGAGVGFTVGAAAAIDQADVLKAVQVGGIQTLTSATGLDWYASWYTGLRGVLKMTGNIMQGASEAYTTEGLGKQVLSGMGTLINDYALHYAPDLAKLRSEYLGIPEVDLGKVVTTFIVNKYILRSNQSNAQLAAEAVNSILFGTEGSSAEQNQLRNRLESWIVSLFDGIDSFTTSQTA